MPPLVYACPMPITRTMKITEILATADSSTDIWGFDGSPEGWMLLINEKAADSGFGKLIDSILEDGWAKGSSIGISNGQICQGHHRLVAAILLGLDEIEVTSYGSSAGRNVCAHGEWDGIYNEFDLFDIPEQSY